MRSLAAAALAAVLVASTAAGAFAIDKEVLKLAKSHDIHERQDAPEPLAKDGPKNAVKLLAKLLVDEEPWVRGRVVWWSKSLQDAELLGPIQKVAKSKDPVNRINAAEALARTKLPEVVPTLVRLALQDGDRDVRIAALHQLHGFAGNAEAQEAAREAARDEDAHVRAFALWTCDVVKCPDARQLVEGALGDADSRVRAVSLLRLAWIDKEAAAVHAVEMAQDENPRVRSTCVMAARAALTRPAMDALVRLVADDDLRTAALAHRSLRGITRKAFQRDADLWRLWWEQARDGWVPPAKVDLRRSRDTSVDTPANIYGAHLTSDALTILVETSADVAEKIKSGEQKTRWDEVREKVLAAVDALPDGTRLNVLTVNEKVEAAFGEPVALNKAKRKKVRSFLERVVPADGCDFWKGLQAALDQPQIDTVVVVSYGFRWGGDFVLRTRVEQAALRRYVIGRQVIHTVRLHDKGRDKSDRSKRAASLLYNLAKDTLGRARQRTFP